MRSLGSLSITTISVNSHYLNSAARIALSYQVLSQIWQRVAVGDRPPSKIHGGRTGQSRHVARRICCLVCRIVQSRGETVTNRRSSGTALRASRCSLKYAQGFNSKSMTPVTSPDVIICACFPHRRLCGVFGAHALLSMNT